MKKSFFIIFLTAMLLPTIVSAADTYIVKKGQCLSGIGQELGKPWRSIAKENNILPPSFIIQIGQKLNIAGKKIKVLKVKPKNPKTKSSKTAAILRTGRQVKTKNVSEELRMPSRFWSVHGGNPYSRTPLTMSQYEKGINSLTKMPYEIRKAFIKMIKTGTQPVVVDLIVGDSLHQMLSGSDVMNDVIVDTKDEKALLWIIKAGRALYGLYDPEVCHNLSWKAVYLPQPKVVVKKIAKPILAITESSPDVKSQVTKEKSSWQGGFNPEFIAFFGNYVGFQKGGSIFYHPVRGKFAGVKARLFFGEYAYRTEDGEDGSGNQVSFHSPGVHVGYTLGDGKDHDYAYSYKQPELGLSYKYRTDNSSANFDIAYAWRKTKGSEGLYQSRQWDEGISGAVNYSNEARRNFGKPQNYEGMYYKDGKKLFPEYAFDLNFLAAFSSKAKHEHNWNGFQLEPNPYDISWVKLNFRQDLWDFFPEDTNSRITPHWNIGVGYEWGDEAYNLSFGPGFKWSWYGLDIAFVDIMNFKIKEGHDNESWQPIFLVVDLTGAWRAYTASQIKTITPEELANKINSEKASFNKIALN